MHARPETAFGLACNGAASVRLVDTSADTGLAFRPLIPTLEAELHLVWRRHRPLSPVAERFLTQIRSAR